MPRGLPGGFNEEIWRSPARSCALALGRCFRRDERVGNLSREQLFDLVDEVAKMEGLG